MVAGELDGSRAPNATLKALAEAFFDSGRTLPMMDELAFRPAAEAAKGSWTIVNYPQLVAALDSGFADTAQAGSTLPILIDGVAAATTIPPERVSAYPSPPGPAPGVSEKAQKIAYEASLRAAVCMPNVSGVAFRRLVDKAGSGEQASDQTGLFYADGSAKTSLSAIAGAATLAARGTLAVCPGLRANVTASTLVIPLSFTSSSPPSVVLACTRDCVYLVTLERADGKPVRAERGALRGDAAPTAVVLSSGAFPIKGGDYHLRVRLVAQVNPGPIWQYLSPKIAAS